MTEPPVTTRENGLPESNISRSQNSGILELGLDLGYLNTRSISHGVIIKTTLDLRKVPVMTLSF